MAPANLCPVHPRLCGEHEQPYGPGEPLPGSSPPVRGTRTCSEQPFFRLRFIPACAGNTVGRALNTTVWAVHPRLCGEHSVVIMPGSIVPGSSPPVRGTRTPTLNSGATCRFIPACAGNTYAQSDCSTSITVHPRLCGEHPLSPPSGAAVGGSSPPVRGTRQDQKPVRGNLRFIPACAGNTGSLPRVRLATTVHPRLCGEHLNLASHHAFRYGSSPPVRGTPPRRQDVVAVTRFIPACAGNTASPVCAPTRTTVHPRLCGEHLPASC